MAKAHLSLRLEDSTMVRANERAKSLSSSRNRLLERYIEEGIRMDEHPGIVFVDGPAGRRPSVIGSGLDVWEIVETVKNSDGSVEAAADYLETSLSKVRVAMSYYGDYFDEIDRWIDRIHRQAQHEEQIWLRTQKATV